MNESNIRFVAFFFQEILFNYTLFKAIFLHLS